MKEYKANIIIYYVVALILLLFILASFIYNFKLHKGVVIALIVDMIFLLILNVKERLAKIITDSQGRQIIFEKTKMFGTEKKTIKVDIDNVNCYIYKRPTGRGHVTCFKIETGEENLTFDIEYTDGWSPEDFKNIIKDVNRINNYK